MIDDARGAIDYDECGLGPTIVLVPGSCSTGAAWRPVIDALNGGFRCVTTSLLGYGKTAERRTRHDTSIFHEAEAIEAVVRKAGQPVHLVGHSFGGLSAVAVALRGRVSLASLVVIEAPAVGLLGEPGEQEHDNAFRRMSDGYIAAFNGGDGGAVATMVDFYGGAGTFAGWPERVRAYATKTTAVNILDWASAYDFIPSPAALAALEVPTLVVRGGMSHPALQRANVILAGRLRNAVSATVDGAAHFLIATHAHEMALLVARHVREHSQERRQDWLGDRPQVRAQTAPADG